MRLFVRVILKFIDPVVVMLSSFPSPIATQFSNAVLSATTGTAEAASGIQRSGYLGFSRFHTPWQRAICSGNSSSGVCSGSPPGPIFKFCGSRGTACRGVCPSSKFCQWILHRQRRFNTLAVVFADGPRTTSYPSGCVRLSTVPVTTTNASAFDPCICSSSTRTATTFKWENRPTPSSHKP